MGGLNRRFGAGAAGGPDMTFNIPADKCGLVIGKGELDSLHSVFS